MGRLNTNSIKKVENSGTVALSTSTTVLTDSAVDTITVITGGTGTAKVEAYIGTFVVDVTAAGFIDLPSNIDKVVISETGGLNSITYAVAYPSGV